MRYIPIFELPILIIMVLIRSAILRRRGIKALVFGVTDKTDFFLVPIILLFFYSLTAAIFNFPLPEILKKPFIDNTAILICAIVICTASLIWFGITLKIFGNSFRVGIDETTKEKLITSGTFAISRNPIYLGFIVFFIGIFFAYPNIITSLFLILLIAAIHRQIIREEVFLKSHYGEEYEKYCSLVRRYI